MSTPHLMKTVLILALGVMASPGLRGQEPPPDSTRVDSTTVISRGRPRFIPGIGSISSAADSVPSFHYSSIVRSDAIYIGNVLQHSPEVFIRDLGEPGQYNELTVNGMDLRSMSLTLDGRPLNDPLTGAYDPYDLPLEYVEQFQLLTTPLAPVLGFRSAGGVLNAVTRQYTTFRPVTKIRYLQGPYQHILTDGLYTQNVARDVNFMLGFQRHVTDGRYANSAYDSWNLRTRFRFDLSDQLNVAVSDFYTKRTIGMNGGVFADSTRSIYNETAATVKSDNASETLSRHDVTLRTAGRFFPDSTDLSLIDIYFTSYDREFHDRSIFGLGKPDFHSSETFGFRVEQRLTTEFLKWNFGGQAHRTNVLESRQLGGQTETLTGLWAGVSLTALDFLQPRAMIRNERSGNDGGLSFGIDLRAPLAGTGLTFSGGYSVSRRIPTLQERSWTDSTVVRPTPLTAETHRLAQVGVEARLPLDIRLRLSGFMRAVENAIVFKPSASSTRFPAVAIRQISDVSYTGATLDAVVPIWRFELHAALAYLEYAEADSLILLFPKYRAYLEFTYKDLLLDGHLLVTLGVRSLAVSTHQGKEFVPQMLLFVDHQGNDVGRFATLDLFASVRVGDAYVLFAWENILDNGYYVTPTYPLLDSNLKIGINWVFLD